jgi:hypothetical protein
MVTLGSRPGSCLGPHEEQVRSRGAARRSDPAECVSLLDLLPSLDVDLGEVEAHADEAVTVVDEHGVALKEQVLGDYTVPSATAKTGVPAVIPLLSVPGSF